MNDNKIKKTSSFFKKEGFYLILFICLCIVGTVAAITAQNQKNAKNMAMKQSQVSGQPSNDYSNALEVKKNNSDKVNTTDEAKATDSSEKTAQVSKTIDTSYMQPVVGTLARAYSVDPVYWESTGTSRPNFGIDIKCALGKPVFAVRDGKVEKVTVNSQDGVEITINHEDGIKTIYSNLNPKEYVKEGQVVKKGTEIGTVGNTTLRSAYEKYGDHIHFAVMKGNDFVDPTIYVKY
jgi:murein DD-endopeptidase MepM/ murein hydrolase activator NlpD